MEGADPDTTSGLTTPVPTRTDVADAVYRQLRAMAHVRMANERDGHTLQTTALVHEAMLKLTCNGMMRLEDRPGFFRAAAASMRQILIDHARASHRLKRGGDAKQVAIDLRSLSDPAQIEPERLLEMDDAMSRLASRDPRAAELVRLRFYAGLSMLEAAETLNISQRTAERLWMYARAWLWRDLGGDDACSDVRTPTARS